MNKPGIAVTDLRSSDRSLTTKDIVYIGVFSVLITICSWISIPTQIPFTLQTFGIFMAVGVLGGKRGTLSVLVYLLMGGIGLPVFAGFTGGPGILSGVTGGYLIGFLFSALFMWGIEKAAGRNPAALLLSMTGGLILCYAFGTFWFMQVYARTTGSAGILAVLGWCVFPFILPDMIKIACAFWLIPRIRKAIHFSI